MLLFNSSIDYAIKSNHVTKHLKKNFFINRNTRTLDKLAAKRDVRNKYIQGQKQSTENKFSTFISTDMMLL